MELVKSSEAAELDSDHSQLNPRFGAGYGALVVPGESPMTHEPAKGALDDPALRQYGKA